MEAPFRKTAFIVVTLFFAWGTLRGQLLLNSTFAKLHTTISPLS
jgi:hypothetical protein